MTTNQQEWIQETAKAAIDSGHIFPQMAACEAALESGFGQSALAREGNNLFGMKQHTHPGFGTFALPTKEYLDGVWVATTADWIKYPTLADCFEDRMATLKRLSTEYPHYGAALAATDPHTYINEVSQTWSTDPARAAKVMQIYNEYFPAVSPIPAIDAGDL